MREKQIKIQVHPNHMGITIMGDQNVSLRNTSLWHKDYFEQKTNEKGQPQKSSPSSRFSITRDDSRLFSAQRWH